MFSDFIEGSSSFLVLEDADLLLKPRSDGNTMMHKFLNVSDGLVSIQGKKIIFSTNLPNMKEVDPALIRKGRCHDVLHFDYLNLTQAKTLASKLELVYTFQEGKAIYSIAELFSGNIPDQVSPKSKFGFI